MSSPVKILIVGGGFGGVYTLKNLHKIFKRNPNVKISIVSDKNYFLFTPLLHEVATGGVAPENIVEPIHKVLGHCLERFHLGKVGKISLYNKTLELLEENRKDILSYDYLVLAPGSETNFYNTPGAEKYSLTLKSLENATAIKNRVILAIESASEIRDKTERKHKLTFVIVGGGATGVELAGELQEFIEETISAYYAKDLMEYVSIVLVQKDKELLTQFPIKFREKSWSILTQKGISVMLNMEVKEITPKQIVFGDGRTINTDTVIWTAGIKPVNLEFQEEISRNPRGQLVVDEHLALVGHPNVFVLGDAAFFKPKNIDSPLPALAQVATKQAAATAKNIKLLIEGKKPKVFTYRSSGSLISLGQWMAIGEIFGFTFSGKIAWFVWRTVYLFKLISWEKKLKVVIDWTVDIFRPRDISKL